jgi:hypothetical protein
MPREVSSIDRIYKILIKKNGFAPDGFDTKRLYFYGSF